MSIQWTVVARVQDGLLLCESSEPLEELSSSSNSSSSSDFRSQSKDILRTISRHTTHSLKIESGPFYFLYLIKGDICFMVLCDKGYSRTMAYNFLDAVANEFHLRYASEISTANRPYHFIKFDPFIQKLKKTYNDTRSSNNLNKVSEELHQAHQIMTKSFQELIGMGERLNSVSYKSNNLRAESEKFSKLAKEVNSPKFFKKYGFYIILSVLIVFAVIYWRFFW